MMTAKPMVGFVSYLNNPDKWSHFDPYLYDALTQYTRDQAQRSVHYIEQAKLIPAAVFCSDTLTDSHSTRKQYFAKVRAIAAESDLVFFDPDNGIEVNSVHWGNRGSQKYIYWNELTETFEAGHSFLVYQHYNRIQRDMFTQNLVDQSFTRLPVQTVITFSTAHVLFILCSQSYHHQYFTDKCQLVSKLWATQIDYCVHRR